MLKVLHKKNNNFLVLPLVVIILYFYLDLKFIHIDIFKQFVIDI